MPPLATSGYMQPSSTSQRSSGRLELSESAIDISPPCSLSDVEDLGSSGSPSSAGSPDSSTPGSPLLSPSRKFNYCTHADEVFATPRWSFEAGAPADVGGAPACVQPRNAAEGPQDPTGKELVNYAGEVLRREARTLWELAARIDPATTQLQELAGSPRSPSIPVPASSEVVPAAADPPHSKTQDHFLKVVRQLADLPRGGKVIISGLGKSGVVARKAVATFNSLGVPAVYLHPVEALHGDLGIVSPTYIPPLPYLAALSLSPPVDFSSRSISEDHKSRFGEPTDAVLLVSYSGRTAELLRLLPIIKPRTRVCVAVTADSSSPLARGCGEWLDSAAPRHWANGQEEADIDLPAPSCSVVAQIGALDAVGLSLGRWKGLGGYGWQGADRGHKGKQADQGEKKEWGKGGRVRREEFGRHHPGGQLGLQILGGTGEEHLSARPNLVG